MDNRENSARDHREPSKAHDSASAQERHEASKEDSTTDRAERLWRKAGHWCDVNPYAWSYIVQLCLHEAACKRRFGMKWAIEQARKKDFATGDGGRFGIDNSYAPAFARMFLEEHPEARRYIVVKPSIFDGLV